MQPHRRLILDAGGVLALAGRNEDARATVDEALDAGFSTGLPTPVVAQVHRGGHDHAKIDRVVNRVDAIIETSLATARFAGVLMAKAGTTDVVDAIVVAEALLAVPSAILTSDPVDILRLIEGHADEGRVRVIRCDS